MKIFTDWDPVLEHLKLKTKCFYCSEKITFPAVVWSGEIDIFLHEYCAEKLGNKLIYDARKSD